MEHNYGREIAIRKNRARVSILLYLVGLLLLGSLVLGGYYLRANPVDEFDTIMGMVAYVMGVGLFIVMFLIARRLKAVVTIFEQGVIVKRRKRTHSFHFSEIRGLRDTTSGDSSGYFFAGGLVGALVMTVAEGLASGFGNRDWYSNNRRVIKIVPNGGTPKDEVKVMKIASTILSQAYTQWLIAVHNITHENIGNLVLDFGDQVEYNNGSIIHKHRKRGNIIHRILDVNSVDFSGEAIQFFAYNEKGKNKAFISLNLPEFLNVDLMFFVYDLAKTPVAPVAPVAAEQYSQ